MSNAFEWRRFASPSESAIPLPTPPPIVRTHKPVAMLEAVGDTAERHFSERIYPFIHTDMHEVDRVQTELQSKMEKGLYSELHGEARGFKTFDCWMNYPQIES